jgi:membrane protein DedA with SNARE-associated domain
MLQWMTSLPPALLYLALAAVAALENFFPPVPADVVVAFGAFLAARAGRSSIPVVIAVLIGNVGGAFAMFALGRRFGTDWIRRRFRLKGEGSEVRFRRLYARWGVPALFVSRFLPGVRAVVPPLAGALRVPTPGALLAIASASMLWYGAITVLAYRTGSGWEQLSASLQRLGRGAAIGASVVALIGVAAFWYYRRRRRA